MKAYEIFQEMLPETATAVFQFLRDEQRDVYSASLASLAANRKLRPVFIQRKPAAQQVEWLVKNIKLRGSGEIAEHAIQLWLLKGNKDLLVDFLDGLGIEHDGEGAADDIPEKFNVKKLKVTVTKLLADHDPEVVRIYLHTFQMQSNQGWPELDKLIADTPELQFSASEEEPEPEVKSEKSDEEDVAESGETKTEASDEAEEAPADEVEEAQANEAAEAQADEVVEEAQADEPEE